MTVGSSTSKVSDECRAILVGAIRGRINPQAPSEGLRDLAEACRLLGIAAGDETADAILFEVQYRAEHGSSQGLRILAETWNLLQPPGRVVDLVPSSPSSSDSAAPIS